MSALISDLLEYSKLSHREPERVEINLAEVLDVIKGEFEYSFNEKNISVQLGQLPTVRGIPVQIHQLFYNLFSNAIKFSKPNHPNKITVKCLVLDSDEQSKHQLDASSRFYMITVQDQGIGFAPQYGEKIFAIFNRLHTKQNYEGHGIGLALCKKIVSNHNGLILATGEENIGATFTIILPIQ